MDQDPRPHPTFVKLIQVHNPPKQEEIHGSTRRKTDPQSLKLNRRQFLRYTVVGGSAAAFRRLCRAVPGRRLRCTGCVGGEAEDAMSAAAR
ncbi:MAG: hypothetical protein R3A10_05560 [Caldilineaceae bacterium]